MLSCCVEESLSAGRKLFARKRREERERGRREGGRRARALGFRAGCGGCVRAQAGVGSVRQSLQWVTARERGGKTKWRGGLGRNAADDSGGRCIIFWEREVVLLLRSCI